MLSYPTELDVYFGELKVEFENYPDKKTSEPRKLLGLYRIIKREKVYWEEIYNKVTNKSRSPFPPIKQVYDRFNTLLNKLNSLNDLEKQEDFEEQAKKTIDEIINIISTGKFPTVFSTSSFGKMAKNIVDKYGEVTLWGYFKGYFPREVKSLPTVHTKNNFKENTLITDQSFLKGLLLAHKINSPELVNEILESKFNEIGQKLEDLYFESEEYKDYIEEYKTALQEEVTNKIEELNEVIQSLEKYKSDKEKEIENLHTYYDEKLMLEKPANHWEDQSKLYKSKGNFWFIVLVCSIIIYIGIFVFLFTTAPDVIDLSVNSIRFTLIATVIASSALLLVKQQLKLINSNYHLANDAQERSNLTYVYLALLNEDKNNSLNQEERAIILQSVFSRSESGLIKSEVGNQMPSSFNQTKI